MNLFIFLTINYIVRKANDNALRLSIKAMFALKSKSVDSFSSTDFDYTNMRKLR